MLWILIVVIAIILLWLWMVCPNLCRRKITRAKLHRFYAHRGAHDNQIPENSMTAYRKAKENGWGIELDIHVTIDGKVVIMHDRNLLRATGVDKNIDEIPYEELRDLTIFNTSEKIPLFSEFLDEMKDVPLLVELKGGRESGNRLCAAAAELLKNYKGDYIVESFNPFNLRWFKRNRPEVIRGQLSTKFRKEDIPLILRIVTTNLFVNHFTRVDFVAYNFEHRHQLGYLIARYIFRMPSLTWTIHPDTREIAEKKFDGIIYEEVKCNEV